MRCSGGGEIESLEELLATYEALDPRKSFATPFDVPLFCIDAPCSRRRAGALVSPKDLLDGVRLGKPREEAYDAHLHDEFEGDAQGAPVARSTVP